MNRSDALTQLTTMAEFWPMLKTLTPTDEQLWVDSLTDLHRREASEVASLLLAESEVAPSLDQFLKRYQAEQTKKRDREALKPSQLPPEPMEKIPPDKAKAYLAEMRAKLGLKPDPSASI